jgi:hypothetical protein
MITSGRNKTNAVDVERAKISPAVEFKRPVDVVKSKTINDEDKKKILKQWEVDARGLSRAGDEGMGDGEPSRLTEVRDARRKASKHVSQGSPTIKDRDGP